MCSGPGTPLFHWGAPCPPYSKGQGGTTSGLLWHMESSNQTSVGTAPYCSGRVSPGSVQALPWAGEIQGKDSRAPAVVLSPGQRLPRCPTSHDGGISGVVCAMCLHISSWLWSPYSRLQEVAEVLDSDKVGRRGEPDSPPPRTWGDPVLPSIPGTPLLLLRILLSCNSFPAFLKLLFLLFSRHPSV